MLRAIIVEDEQASRETLKNYLGKYCPDVNLVGEASNVNEGLTCIKKFQPEIVFLDVEMPYGNAFDLLEQVEEISFEIIFVTAYSDYAIQALNLSACYYILKPIDIDELVKAIEKIKETFIKKQDFMHTKALIDNIKIENKQLLKIALPLMDGFEVIKVGDIIRCEAQDNFTEFHLLNGQKRLICRTLKFYENLLKDCDFIRVHKSHMVNLNYIHQYKKGKGGQLIMQDGKAVDVAQNKKQDLLERFR